MNPEGLNVTLTDHNTLWIETKKMWKWTLVVIFDTKLGKENIQIVQKSLFIGTQWQKVRTKIA